MFKLDQQEQLLDKSLDLLDCIIEQCSLRIHAHAKRIINFLMRLIYVACLAESASKPTETVSALKDIRIIRHALELLKILFQNVYIKNQYYQEFANVKNEKTANLNFLNLIYDI